MSSRHGDYPVWFTSQCLYNWKKKTGVSVLEGCTVEKQLSWSLLAMKLDWRKTQARKWGYPGRQERQEQGFPRASGEECSLLTPDSYSLGPNLESHLSYGNECISCRLKPPVVHAWLSRITQWDSHTCTTSGLELPGIEAYKCDTA